MSVVHRVWLWAKWIGTIIGLVIVALVIVGVGYEQMSRLSVRSEFPPPGEVLTVDGAEMHINCTGTGSPIVILESGLTGLGSMQWHAVQPAVAEFTMVCAYDRAGILWSDHRGRPRTGEMIVQELDALLDAASVSPPYVLVGHSLGGLLIRMFDDQFPGEATGFVFIDSAHPDQLNRMPPESHDTVPPPEWTLTALGATGLIRLMSAGTVDDVPASVRRIIEAYAPQSVHGLYAEMASVEDTVRQAREAGSAPSSLGSRPVIVLTRGQFEAERVRTPWVEMQREIEQLSDNSDRRVISEAEHFIHLYDPDSVVQAIREIVVSVRENDSIDGRDNQ